MGSILLDENGGLFARVKSGFADREFIMRSQGQVRFVRISARFQAIGAIVVMALLCGWLATIGAAIVTDWTQRDRAQVLSARAAKVATAESRVAAYRAGLDDVAEDLSQRQKFIETMVEAHLGDLPDARGDEGTAETRDTVKKISAAVPEAAGLARLEARQIAFVDGLTKLADARAERAAKAIRDLGLDPGSIARSADTSAMGGPFEALFDDERSIDPRFTRLESSLARMQALERGLKAIPNVLPARIDMISSRFGYRRDPFTGRAAMHSGLDFRGPTGTPIHAAADGRVTFVGNKGGYGRTVEISHANGLVTRYAHMSAYEVKRGQRVDAGSVIGKIGSTGRSTGPHLHFEVRHHGRAINPKPLLDKGAAIIGAVNVLEVSEDPGHG